jgi:hypothetical protein
MIGPSIEPLGEVKQNMQLYQAQIAQTIAELMGEKFEPEIDIAKAGLQYE